MCGKRLYKSSTDKKFMGVCGGLGDFFGIDPTIIRVIFLLIFWAYGFGFMLYMILGLVLPYDYQVEPSKSSGFYQGQNPFNNFGQSNDNRTQQGRRDVTPDDADTNWDDF